MQIVAPEPGVTLWGATFTPDATSIDFVRQPVGAPADVWRVPFLGGTPRLLIRDATSGIGWAPDGQRMAFLRTRVTPTLTTELIVAAPDGGQERVLASSTADVHFVQLSAPWRPNIPPAWSPDGLLIAVSAARIERSRRGTCSLRGQPDRVDAGGHGAERASVGLGWLDPHALVLNVSATRRARSVVPADVSSRLRDTTDQRSERLRRHQPDERSQQPRDRPARCADGRVGGRWRSGHGHRRGATCAGQLGGLAWSGDRLLYSGRVGGRPAILRVTPGEGTSEEVLVDAALAGGHERWQYDCVRLDIQRRPQPLDRGCQRSPDHPTCARRHWLGRCVVTPNDRSVLYRSTRRWDTCPSGWCRLKGARRRS